MFEHIIHDGPIIDSPTDLDDYKLTMGQLINVHHPVDHVESGFINRTKTVNFGASVLEEELREQLDHVRTLRFSEKEINYLAARKGNNNQTFKPAYLDFLRGYQAPEYNLSYRNNNPQLFFPGQWGKQTYWETLALSIGTELFSRAQVKGMNKQEQEAFFIRGDKRLDEKIKRLKEFPDIKLSDFTTRRRAFREWHKYAVQKLASELPNQFLGTSNVKLAMDLGLKPIGTNAHETSMVYSRLFGSKPEDIIGSQATFWLDWWNLYGPALSIALPDTFGTDFFLKHFDYENALRSKGFRQDSGDPLVFGEKVIAFYEKLGIDPRYKVIIFSDALDVETMIKIFLHFNGRIQVAFGWGTNFGNDLGLVVLSLVVKVLFVNGLGTVKLSDDLNKALGRPEDVEFFKHVVGYVNTCRRTIVY